MQFCAVIDRDHPGTAISVMKTNERYQKVLKTTDIP